MAEQKAFQDKFLNTLRKSKQEITVYLLNGVKLQGNISDFDRYGIMLRRGTACQLIYKHAISTIMPNGPLTLYRKPEEQGAEATGATGAEDAPLESLSPEASEDEV